jgi:hypothetical protein
LIGSARKWLWAQNLYSHQPNEKMPLVYR